jgi:signal transduction histidine kinase
VTSRGELEQRERAQRAFITNAAHELQSPLAGIISAIEVLQAGAKDTPDRDRFLTHIERESHRLERLTRAMLVLARAQSLLEPPKSEIVLIAPLLSRIVAEVEPAVDVEITVACPEGLAAVVNAELTEQALHSVIENAAKYTSRGRIEIEASTASDRAVEIRVSDTGPGIAEEARARVFERFYRAPLTRAEGFGLGLAIAKEAIDVQTGKLELESDEGGTRVTVCLPLAARVVQP